MLNYPFRSTEYFKLKTSNGSRSNESDNFRNIYISNGEVVVIPTYGKSRGYSRYPIVKLLPALIRKQFLFYQRGGKILYYFLRCELYKEMNIKLINSNICFFHYASPDHLRENFSNFYSKAFNMEFNFRTIRLFQQQMLDLIVHKQRIEIPSPEVESFQAVQTGHSQKTSNAHYSNVVECPGLIDYSTFKKLQKFSSDIQHYVMHSKHDIETIPNHLPADPIRAMKKRKTVINKYNKRTIINILSSDEESSEDEHSDQI